MSYNARKALSVHIGEAAGNEIANLLQRMAAQIEELKRNKVNVTTRHPRSEARDVSARFVRQRNVLMSLEREEYVEQAYLFRVLCDRVGRDVPVQDLLTQIYHELLSTTKLPMAVSFLATELKHHGIMADGMRRLSHYFSPWQSFLIEQSEEDRGRFDFVIALKILQAEAEFSKQIR